MNERRIKYTPVFTANKQAYESKEYRVIANEGSSRSSKTVSLSQLLALYIPYKEKKTISIVSPSLPHLKRGARRDCLNVLQMCGVYDDNAFNKTDNIYNYPNGSYVEFFGVEDAGKVHGPGRDVLWVNEANLIPFEVYKQLAIRTNDIIFLDYNPADEHSWVYDVADFTGREENGRWIKPSKIIHSTYLNNKGNLTPELISEIESLKHADENMWKVYGLGQRGTSQHTIYTHWRTCGEMPGKGEVWFGLDFGFQNATALIQVEEYEGVLYVDEWVYQSKLTTQDLIDEMMVLGVSHNAEIFGDSASPGAIEELRRAGYNVFEASKDVLEGIRKVKSMPLRITQRSANLLKEIKSYKWKQTKDGKIAIPEQPVKFHDHAMDAMRYAVYTKLTQQSASWTAF